MSSTYTQRVAAELRAEAARKQITGTSLSQSVGKPQTTVSRWLSGGTPLTVDTIEALCRALGISVGDVISRAQAAYTEGGDMAENRCTLPSLAVSASSQVRGLEKVPA